jgi:hypothetical protein
VLSALFILKHLMELCRGFEESEEQSPTLEPPRNVAAASVEYIPANYFDYIGESSDNCTKYLSVSTNIFTNKPELVQGGKNPMTIEPS